MATRKRIFCDTNFILDVCDKDRAAHADSIALLWYCSDNFATSRLIASITSFKDAYYILSRLYKDSAEARDSIELIMGTFIEPVSMLSNYGPEALLSDESDFEDGLIRVCAEHEDADVIITRDDRAFTSCSIPSMTSGTFLKQVGFSYDVIDF